MKPLEMVSICLDVWYFRFFGGPENPVFLGFVGVARRSWERMWAPPTSLALQIPPKPWASSCHSWHLGCFEQNFKIIQAIFMRDGSTDRCMPVKYIETWEWWEWIMMNFDSIWMFQVLFCICLGTVCHLSNLAPNSIYSILKVVSLGDQSMLERFAFYRYNVARTIMIPNRTFAAASTMTLVFKQNWTEMDCHTSLVKSIEQRSGDLGNVNGMDMIYVSLIGPEVATLWSQMIASCYLVM